jgi:hypothetical protein
VAKRHTRLHTLVHKGFPRSTSRPEKQPLTACRTQVRMCPLPSEPDRPVASPGTANKGQSRAVPAIKAERRLCVRKGDGRRNALQQARWPNADISPTMELQQQFGHPHPKMPNRNRTRFTTLRTAENSRSSVALGADKLHLRDGSDPIKGERHRPMILRLGILQNAVDDLCRLGWLDGAGQHNVPKTLTELAHFAASRS